MRSVEFLVSPITGGWMVKGGPDLEPLVFRSGGRAEAKAVAMAQAMTAAGVDTQVVILDRSGQMVGTKRFWAREDGGLAGPGAPEPGLAVA